MEVGEYFRTENGKIHKWSKGRTYTGKNKIVKHSKNIIDLIEVGDYINNERVSYITKTKNGRIQIITEDNTDFFLKYEEIDTILTHELYEATCYKVGE